MGSRRERRKWISIDSKSFELSVEGFGSKLKGVVKERSRGRMLWIRFGEESGGKNRNLL